MELLARYIPLGILLALSSASVIVGDAFAKSWSVHQRGWMLAFAFAGYLGSALFYIPSLLKEGLIVTSVIWSLVSTIGFLVIGLLFFHETMSRWQAVAVVLGVLSLVVFAFAE
jgi:multidrug transporter EmrE-like cation transporter